MWGLCRKAAFRRKLEICESTNLALFRCTVSVIDYSACETMFGPYMKDKTAARRRCVLSAAPAVALRLLHIATWPIWHGVCFTFVLEIIRFWLRRSCCLSGRFVFASLCSSIEGKEKKKHKPGVALNSSNDFSFSGRLARFQFITLILMTLQVFRGFF